MQKYCQINFSIKAIDLYTKCLIPSRLQVYREKIMAIKYASFKRDNLIFILSTGKNIGSTLKVNNNLGSEGRKCRQ